MKSLSRAAEVQAAGLDGRLDVPVSALRRATWWASLIGLCVLLVVPLMVVDVPPLSDYPNHLARAFVLQALPNDPVIATFFAPRWAIIPNLAIDLIAPPLIRVLPVHDVGRLLIAASVLLPVLGTVAYSAALGGRWWSLAVGLIAYNGTLLEGFLNFSLSIGLALLLAAAWLRWRESHPVRTILLSVMGAAGLFVCHLMGLLFFALLVASAEVSRVPRDRPTPRVLLRSAVSRGSVLLLILAEPAGLYAASPLGRLGGDAVFPSASQKLVHLLAPFTNYSLALDVCTALVVVAFMFLCLLLRRGRMPGPAAIAACISLVAYLASPYAWKGTYQLDTRFAIMLGFMLFAGFVPLRWPVWLSHAAVAAVLLLFVARMALLTTAWAQHRADLADLRQALVPVLPGQAVYVASVSPTDAPAYWARAPWPRHLSDGVQTDTHLGALALIERRAWWPFEFDIPSQQPIETRQPYRDLAVRIGDLPNQATLLKADLCGFDVVLLTQADAAPDLPEQRFHLLVRAGFAALYAITDCHPAQ
ncbi:hypothetical protein [Rhodopila sp.]|uniref:hypothetical protein n=1 Tax=Rhodopila sp. TaxID=2480087 RepID=UPI003D0ACC0A